MLENLVVAIIVSIAVINVIWRWMPRNSKRKCVDRIVKFAIKNKLLKLAKWFGNDLQTSGCGSCSSCKACDTKPSPEIDQKERRKSIQKIIKAN